ncbi:MAG: PadR family transcriptional regulator [Candidatus Bathyarchaeia archaeon]
MCPHGQHRMRRHHHRHGAFPESGWVQFLVLRVLYERPMHGYRLIEELESRGYVVAGRFKTGSIYTILKRMEHRGLLSSEEGRSESGRPRKTYEVTPMGVEALKTGLRGVIRRKQIMDDLASFYREQFPDGEDGGSMPDEENEKR